MRHKVNRMPAVVLKTLSSCDGWPFSWLLQGEVVEVSLRWQALQENKVSLK